MTVPVTFVTFACNRDISYAKALLGSISYFYPTHQIRVVLDADVARRDAEQIAAFPNVTAHSAPELNAVHKINLTKLLNKLNVLFLPGVERALVADADSVLVDMVLDRIPDGTIFAGLASHGADLRDSAVRENFSTWAVDLNALDKLNARIKTPDCYFVGGSHFYVDVQQFPKQKLFDLLPHMGFEHGTTTPLRAGDQGFWTFMSNFSESLPRERTVFMDVAPDAWATSTPRYPQANDLSWISEKRMKEISFIHYIGYSRRWRWSKHEFPTALQWALGRYYDVIGKPMRYYVDEVHRSLSAARRRFS